MIPKACRDLLALCLETARKTESDALAYVNIERATGMVNYALTRGDITAVEHGNEMAWIELARATRAHTADSLEISRGQPGELMVKAWQADDNGVKPAKSEDGAYRFNPFSGGFE